MADYTDQEQDTIRRAAFGAIALVSQADPGFFATFKESAAGSKALAAAPDSIKKLFTGGLIAPPTGSKDEIEKTIIEQLGQANTILAKDPADQAAFKDVITAAATQVAEASKGTSDTEKAVIEKVTAALAGGGAAPSAPTA